MKFVMIYEESHPFQIATHNMIMLNASDGASAKEEAFIRLWLADNNLTWIETDGPMTIQNLVDSLKRDGQWGKMVMESAERIEEDPGHERDMCILSLHYRHRPFRMLTIVGDEPVTVSSLDSVALDAREELKRDIVETVRERRKREYERLKAEFEPANAGGA